jgi:membrane-associated phospholipid phosphatase
MESPATIQRRLLPNGWRDLGRQLLIWFGFLFAYQVARGLADRGPAVPFQNGWRVIALEQRVLHRLPELTLQRLVDSSGWLTTAAAWTYWNSEFAVVGLTLLWVYLRRNQHFVRFRNTLLLTNLLGLVGYVAWPTAPPRMFVTAGFHDTLASLSHGSGLALLADPYAAMPSLHAADALIVAVMLARACRRWWSQLLWAGWPVWVWIDVVATGNHFLLDVAAGIGVALIALLICAAPTRLRAAA